MSKLTLGRAKLASGVLPAFGQEPPDKKRKTDHDTVATDSAWDDDLDILLTQNMNKLDSLVASTQSAAQNGFDELEENCNDVSNYNSASTVDLLYRQATEQMCSGTSRQTVTSGSKRLIGHGSSHSRSADCLNSSTSGSSVQMERKGSFSVVHPRTGNKESDKLQSFISCQAKQLPGTSLDGVNVVKSFPPSDTVTISTLPMRLDANANCTKMQLTQMTEECEYYKAEVGMLSAVVYEHLFYYYYYY